MMRIRQSDNYRLVGALSDCYGCYWKGMVLGSPRGDAQVECHCPGPQRWGSGRKLNQANSDGENELIFRCMNCAEGLISPISGPKMDLFTCRLF